MVNKKFFLNFKNIFSSYYNDLIFIDTHHTSPNGNIIVAKEIYKELKNRLWTKSKLAQIEILE